MTQSTKFARVFSALLLCTTVVAGQEPLQATTTVDESSIAGRPVALDSHGKLLPWPMPDSTGYSYSSYFLSQWSILWYQYHRQRLPYFFCCFDFDRTTFEMTPDWHWANSTGYLRAMMQGFVERLYPYTGDPHMLEFLQNFVDYELESGLTPEGYAWAQVPYPSANAGSRRYTGWSDHGDSCGWRRRLRLSRLYEMTGNTRYLRGDSLCRSARQEFQAWRRTQLAPADESHLLGSLSVVTKIAHGAGSVTYSTFDDESTDVLRVNFSPDSVTVGGKPIPIRKDLEQQGYAFELPQI